MTLPRPELFKPSNARDDYAAWGANASIIWLRPKGRATAVPAVRALLDTVYNIALQSNVLDDPMESGEIIERRVVLNHGGILYQGHDGILYAMQPNLAKASFDRSFSDGQLICGLSDGLTLQANAIKIASVNMKNRVVELMRQEKFQTLEAFMSEDLRQSKLMDAATNRISEWRSNLHAHARDLHNIKEPVFGVD